MHGRPDQIGREHHQRDLIVQRWKKMGMQANDVGLIADVDETPSRDFLRAVQMCDITQFKQDGPKPCAQPKITTSALVFESAPDCITKRRWAHPDFVIGACIEGIRNSAATYTPDRAWEGTAWLNDGYVKGSDWSGVPKDAEHFPLFKAADFRRQTSFGSIVNWPSSHSAFHYHNAIESVEVLRNKYLTYGHPVKDAMTMNLADVNADVNAMIECVLGRPTGKKLKHGLEPGGLAARKASNKLGPIPIAFDVPGYAEQRMAELRDIINKTFV